MYPSFSTRESSRYGTWYTCTTNSKSHPLDTLRVSGSRISTRILREGVVELSLSPRDISTFAYEYTREDHTFCTHRKRSMDLATRIQAQRLKLAEAKRRLAGGGALDVASRPFEPWKDRLAKDREVGSGHRRVTRSRGSIQSKYEQEQKANRLGRSGRANAGRAARTNDGVYSTARGGDEGWPASSSPVGSNKRASSFFKPVVQPDTSTRMTLLLLPHAQQPCSPRRPHNR